MIIDHEITEFTGQADGGEEISTVLQVEVEVRFGRVPRVATPPDDLASVDCLPELDRNASLCEVSQEAVFSLGVPEENKVAPKIRCPPIDPSCTRSRVIADAIPDSDYNPVRRSADWLAIGVVVRELPPVSSVSSPLLIGDVEIIGKALVNNPPGVRGLLIDTAICDGPHPAERKGEHRFLRIDSWHRKTPSYTGDCKQLSERVAQALPKEARIK